MQKLKRVETSWNELKRVEHMKRMKRMKRMKPENVWNVLGLVALMPSMVAVGTWTQCGSCTMHNAPIGSNWTNALGDSVRWSMVKRFGLRIFGLWQWHYPTRSMDCSHSNSLTSDSRYLRCSGQFHAQSQTYVTPHVHIDAGIRRLRANIQEIFVASSIAGGLLEDPWRFLHCKYINLT